MISRWIDAGPLEVATVFGDDFLAKRFAAGKEEGVVKGREEMRVEVQAELRRLLAENPETFADQVKDWLSKGGAPRNDKNPG